MPNKYSHILICRIDNIGDVVLTLPITALLKAHFPDAKISFMCRSYAAPVVRLCETVDTVVELDKITDHSKYMIDAGIDTVIFAQPDYGLAWAACKARVRTRIGHLKYWFNILYCNRRPYFRLGSSRRHEAQLNFSYLQPLGINTIPDRVAIPQLYRFNIKDRSDITEMLSSHKFNLIFHPKSNGHGREWPASHFLELAKLLAEEPDVKIWITGSAKEGMWLDQHAPELLAQRNIGNLCGKLSLEELAILIKSADGLIASGTGPLHMAGAFGQNALGLFPPTQGKNPERWGVIGTRGHSLCEVAMCETCNDSKKHEAMTCACMSNIKPSAVLEIVSRWTHEKAGASRTTVL